MVRTHEGSIIYVCTRFEVDSSICQLKSYKGHKISKMGHVTLSHAPFEPETLSLCRNPSNCQMFCFYLDPLLSTG